ncbi:class D beta-lactamase [Paenibacillus chartarius]|uniref:beta-lactamase n=1 Tax=Paenibacillus chartarius TaxID=747481 RepID=A0ABV6DUD5_9BACL
MRIGLKHVIAPIVLSVLVLMAAMTTDANAGSRPKPIEVNLGYLFNGTEGTFVAKNLRTDKVYVFNPTRSRERFTPESSFKVTNALIGLEEKAVEDEYDVKRWDGIEREFEVWNRDHSLASAMRHSAIWYYQIMARDIGSERMQDYLDRFGYGNRDISGGISNFWLNSSLKISAIEQLDFLEKLVEEQLPVKEKTMKTVKRIMIDLEHDDYTIHGKTGTRLSDMGLGWYIGYVETNKETWIFAINIDGPGSKAKQIALNALQDLRVME